MQNTYRLGDSIFVLVVVYGRQEQLLLRLADYIAPLFMPVCFVVVDFILFAVCLCCLLLLLD